MFLWLPPALRLARLHQRERVCYGEAIDRNPTRAAQSKAFLAWAAGYDDNSSIGQRTLASHMAWLGRLNCPVLELRGDLPVAERLQSVQSKLRELEQGVD